MVELVALAFVESVMGGSKTLGTFGGSAIHQLVIQKRAQRIYYNVPFRTSLTLSALTVVEVLLTEC